MNAVGVAGSVEGQGLRRHSWNLVLAILMLVYLPATTTGQETKASFESLAANATAAREQGDIVRAIELYRQAVEVNPKWPDGWWFLGSLEYASNQYTSAIDALNHYLELNPNAGPATAMRGLCKYETGEYDGALQDIERGLVLTASSKSRNAEILRYHDALLLTRAGRFEDALRSYGMLIQGQTGDPSLFLAIGLAGLRKPVLPRDVDSVDTQLLTAAGNAVFVFMQGDESGAQQTFHALFRNYPSAANTHYLYGYLLYPKNPEQAIVEFKQEVEISPTNAEANAMLAWALLMQGDYSGGLPYARQAAQLQPGLSTAQLALGRLLVETGDEKGGIEHLEKALQLDANNLETHLALVKAYSKLGRADDARRERLQCLAISAKETPAIAAP